MAAMHVNVFAGCGDAAVGYPCTSIGRRRLPGRFDAFPDAHDDTITSGPIPVHYIRPNSGLHPDLPHVLLSGRIHTALLGCRNQRCKLRTYSRNNPTHPLTIPQASQPTAPLPSYHCPQRPSSPPHPQEPSSPPLPVRPSSAPQQAQP